MCTPQIQQAIAGAQAAGIIPSQQVNPQQAIAAGQMGATMGQSAPQAIYPKQVIESAILGGLAGQNNEPQYMMHESIDEIAPQHYMRKEYAPIPLEKPIQRQPTVGEILGIKPGQYEEVGGPGDFRNLNVPLR
jgi:hypothetical protein